MDNDIIFLWQDCINVVYIALHDSVMIRRRCMLFEVCNVRFKDLQDMLVDIVCATDVNPPTSSDVIVLSIANI